MKNLVKLVVAIMVVMIVATTGTGLFAQRYETHSEFPKTLNNSVVKNPVARCTASGHLATSGAATYGAIVYAGTTIPQYGRCVMVSDSLGAELFVVQSTVASGREILGIKFAPNEDLLVLLAFQNTITIEGGSYTSMGEQDILFIIYNSSGVHQDTYHIGGSDNIVLNDVDVAPNGDYRLVGSFENDLYVDGVNTGEVATGNEDFLLLSLSSTGGYAWASQVGIAGGAGDDEGYSIVCDNNGNNYCAFHFYGSNVPFGNGIVRTVKGARDLAVAKYSNTGVCQMVFQFGGSSDEYEQAQIALVGTKVFFQGRVSSTNNFYCVNADNSIFSAFATITGNMRNSVCAWMDFSTGMILSSGRMLSNDGDVNIVKVAILGDTAHCTSGYGGTLTIDDGFGSNTVTFSGGGIAWAKIAVNGVATSVHQFDASTMPYGMLSDPGANRVYVALRGGTNVDLDPDPNATVSLSSDKRGIAKYDCNPLVLPVIVAQPVNTTGCEGSSLFVEVTATGVDSYQWKKNNIIVSGATDSILWFNLAVLTDAGSYFCELTNATGTINTDTVSVTVNADPTPIITGDTVICNGATGTLDAGSYSSYLWNTGETTQTIDVITAGTYSVTVTNSNGCEGTDDVLVVVNANPTPVIIGDTVICAGETGALDAGAYASYLWNTGATTQTIDVTTAGTYSVDVTNSNGCTGTDDVTVVVHELPTPSISGDTPVCEGTEGTYITGTFDSYSWSIDPVSAGTITSGQGTFEIDVDWSDSGDVLLDVTNANGCSGSTSFAITVNDNPVANAGTDQSIPYGTSTTLDGSATGGDGNYVYSWTPINMVIDPSDPNTETVDLTVPQTFVLEVTDGNACVSNTDDVFIDVTGGPLGLAPDADPEATCGNTEVQLSANAYGGTENYTYSWTSDPVGFTSTEENPVETPTETTTYLCEVNDGNTTETGEVTVTVYDPIVTDAGSDMNLEIGQSTQFDGSYTGGSSDETILWEGVNNSITIDDASALNPNVGPFPTTDVYYFTLTVTDNITGCENTDTMFVDVVLGVWDSSISNNIKIYPNPTSGNIFIDAMERPEIISITNMTGNEVIHLENPKKMTQIDLSSFPSGMYFIGITFKSGYIIKKIDKK